MQNRDGLRPPENRDDRVLSTVEDTGWKSSGVVVCISSEKLFV